MEREHPLGGCSTVLFENINSEQGLADILITDLLYTVIFASASKFLLISNGSCSGVESYMDKEA